MSLRSNVVEDPVLDERAETETERAAVEVAKVSGRTIPYAEVMANLDRARPGG